VIKLLLNYFYFTVLCWGAVFVCGKCKHFRSPVSRVNLWKHAMKEVTICTNKMDDCE